MRIARAVSTCSLLLCACWLIAGPYADLSARIKGRDPAAVVQIVAGSSLASDAELAGVLERSDIGDEQKARDLTAAIDMRAMLEQPAAVAPAPASEIKKIKTSPMYRDPGVEESSNWLARALERLKAIKLNNQANSGDFAALAFLGPILYVLMWVLIAAVLAALVYFAVKHITWRQRLERKASALLEDTEPERTLDEWLEQADRLEAEGKYREAVRALYLACLLRFDEALIARFDRGQTNWEHLARIERSPKLPPDLDFRTPTQLFDRVWYGHQVRGREDSQQFRAWYLDITEALRRKAA